MTVNLAQIIHYLETRRRHLLDKEKNGGLSTREAREAGTLEQAIIYLHSLRKVLHTV